MGKNCILCKKLMRANDNFPKLNGSKIWWVKNCISGLEGKSDYPNSWGGEKWKYFFFCEEMQIFLIVAVLLQWPNGLSEAIFLWFKGLAYMCRAQQSSPTLEIMVWVPCVSIAGMLPLLLVSVVCALRLVPGCRRRAKLFFSEYARELRIFILQGRKDGYPQS